MLSTQYNNLVLREALQDVIEDYFTIPQSDNSSENDDSDDDRGK